MKQVLIVIGTIALISISATANAKAKTIVLSDGLQECLFGDNAAIDSEAEKEALLAYAISVLREEQQPTKNALVNECLTKEKSSDEPTKEVTRSIRISGYDVETKAINARDYDFSFKFHEGPFVKVPFLGDSMDLEVNMTAFLKVDEIEGAGEVNEITQYGVDFGSLKYNRWQGFRPYLTFGYLNLDERTTNAASGEVTNDTTSNNAKFLFGAEISILDNATIKITHEVGFKNGFSDKTLSRSGADFELTW